MKLYYIDDSFFQRTPTSQQILFRFERYFHKNGRGSILISSSTQDNAEIDYFCEMMPNAMVLLSPSLFDIEGIRGNLSSTSLDVEGFPTMHSHRDTCVVYDTELQLCQRIYFDVFLEHEEDMDELIQEMEQMLSDKIQHMKKKIILN